MKKWYVKNLGEASFADESLDRIKTLFSKEYEEAGRPADMAVFMRHESEGRLHCEIMIYFSAAADSIAKKVDAMPATKPSLTGLDIFCGPKKAWSVLFPENGL